VNESTEKKIDPEKEEASPKKGWGTPLVGICVTLAIYVLSLGPMCRLYDLGKLSKKTASTFEIIYSPLKALSTSSSIADDFFEWYVHLWRRPAQIKTSPSSQTSAASPSQSN
jgi:hypothetical protein